MRMEEVKIGVKGKREKERSEESARKERCIYCIKTLKKQDHIPLSLKVEENHFKSHFLSFDTTLPTLCYIFFVSFLQ